jgi:D-inositol-3-phosphate glycosyltransferase
MSAGQLRICMLSAHSCPVGKLGTRDTGGMSVYIRETASELGKRGHLVDVYTRVHDPDDRQVYELGQNARLIHLRAGGDEEMHKLVLYSHLPDFVSNLENFRKHNNLRYDLIFSHYWLSGLAGTYLQQSWRVPHITMFHTLGAVKNAIREKTHLTFGRQEPKLRIETERQLVRKCHRIIAPTERERLALVRLYGASPKKISVVPCGVNLSHFKIIGKDSARRYLGFDGDKIILFVGRIDPLKGIENLIKALPHLRNIPKIRLTIVGGDERSRREVQQLQKLARDLEVLDSVTFLGLIKHERLPYFYNASDACVVPSYYESSGLVALESLACGTPVVATDVGNHRNLIRQGETGYLIEDNAPRLLADKINLLVSDSGTDTRSAQLIRASVSQFGWSKIAERIIRVCQLALSDLVAAVP